MVRFYTVILVLISFYGYGQVYDNVDEIENSTNLPQKSSSILDWKSRLHTGLSSSFFVDFITSPLSYIDIVYTDPGNIKRIEKGAVQTTYTSFYTIGFVPRYNVYEIKNNLALAVSAPIAIGFGNAIPASESVNGGSGFGNLQLPIFLNIFYGAESTYNAQDQIGFNLGYGIEFNKIGLLSFSSSPQNENMNKSWVMPAFTAGAQFYRGLSPMEVNVKFGYGGIENQRVDQYGNPLLNGKRITRASSIKLSVIYYF
jgi:hypothetical protein